MAGKLIQKSIRFPAAAIRILETVILDDLGITFNEYLKAMVINDAIEAQRRLFDKQELTPYARHLIVKAKKDVAEGKTKVLRTRKDIEEYVNSIETTPTKSKDNKIKIRKGNSLNNNHK